MLEYMQVHIVRSNTFCDTSVQYNRVSSHALLAGFVLLRHSVKFLSSSIARRCLFGFEDRRPKHCSNKPAADATNSTNLTSSTLLRTEAIARSCSTKLVCLSANPSKTSLSDETLTFVDRKLSLPLSDGSEIASFSSKLNCSSVVSSMNNLSNSSKSISYSELAAILISNSEFDPSPLHHTFLLGRARFTAQPLSALNKIVKNRSLSKPNRLQDLEDSARSQD